ncbi:MAG TPA: alkaline phosphatase family protein, partial [Candidatus Hydrogenedentes bacterium]|nr:alkaline phosphatase family protein [Candidatus Hydrogenedentota bacterium]
EEAVAPAPAPAGPIEGPRVVILGFDGVEPGLVEEMIAKGELPNLAKLKQEGTFAPLQTTVPPLSPVAWASFATSKNPAVHGVFDFLGRDAAKYRASTGEGRLEQPKLGGDGSVLTPAQYVSNRKGDAFWLTADAAGKRTKVLRVPFAFPVDALKNGAMLGGEGVPDIRGTASTSLWMSDTVTEEQLRDTPPGGYYIKLAFTDDKATPRIPTARDPRPGRPSSVQVPITIAVDREKKTVTMELPSGPVTVEQGKWSDWIEWTFVVTPTYNVQAISRFHVIEAGEHVRIYMTCMQMHPRAPLVPISTPGSYSAELADRYGLYETIGWSHDTNALRRDALPEDVFLADARAESDWVEHLALDELDRRDAHLFIACWTETDRVSHTFWRYRDPKHPLYTAEGAAKYGRVVEDTYKRMDETVGKVVAKLAPDDFLMILSDHGFHSFRTGFSLTTWLVRNGYLAVEGQTDPATAANEKGDYLSGYDWSRTKAYAIGVGGIYLNLKGREGNGIVSPEESVALVQEIRDKLLQVVNPDTGEKVFAEVYIVDDVAQGAAANAPDIQLGYAEGYQTSKPSARGAAPAELFLPNEDKWSGDHAASAANVTRGIFFSNKPLAGAVDPSILDLAPTTLEFLNVEIPNGYQGRSLLK